VSKDRARPFSRKHRRYWIPITGGMLLIGALNVSVGFCSYEGPGKDPERIKLVLPPPTVPTHAVGYVDLAQVPAAVMRAFAVAYPRHVPSPKQLGPDTYELSYSDAGVTHHLTYRADGTLLGER